MCPKEKLVWNLGGRGEAGAITLWGVSVVGCGEEISRGPSVLLDVGPLCLTLHSSPPWTEFPPDSRMTNRSPGPVWCLPADLEVEVTQRSELPKPFSEWSLCKEMSFASQISLKISYSLPRPEFSVMSQKPICIFFPQCLPQLFKVWVSEVAQSCLTLCDPMDCSLPGSSIHGIFQARILEWVAISFSRRSSWPRDWTHVSHIVGRRFTVWTTREVLFRSEWVSEWSCSVMSDSLQPHGL